MSHAKLFRELIEVFKCWPVDATKSGRCLGQHLRQEFSKAFRNGEFTENVDSAHWTKVLRDLKPIANNEYAARYPRVKATGALGLGREQCKLVVSNQGIEMTRKYRNDEM